MLRLFIPVFLCFLFVDLFAQQATIIGTVKDQSTQEPLIGVTVTLQNQTGAATDVDGAFKIVTEPGSYNITASYVGYQSQTRYNVVLTSGNVNSITFELKEDVSVLGEVVVEARSTAEAATVETPLSIQKLTTEEIRSNPGGNFDISRVIQALPGVGGATGTAGFRNDIIIRGGAPNENVYYLDGIEIPVINHFSTQGSAGGPQGILNVSFIEDVTLSTSAFDARYDNTLSSVLQFKQRDGNSERLQGNVRLSGTELAATFDGPINKKTTFLASARRSYLEFLFKLIDLPIRPNYWDFQYKITHSFNSKTTLSFLGVGAIDQFSFAIPKNSTPESIYVIRSNPLIQQNSYTVGLSLRRRIDNGYWNVALSRNSLENNLDKFEDGTAPQESERTLKVRSTEAENKLRFDLTKNLDGFKYTGGFTVQYVQFSNNTFNVIQRDPAIIYDYQSELNLVKGGLFFQASKKFGALTSTAGVRSDINSFTTDGANPLKTLSPRLGLSYSLSSKWNVNASIGKYYKLPVYTTLGFKNQDTFVNKNVSYIGSAHAVAGIEFLPESNFRITVEGFYKKYDHYPVSLRDGTSIANTGVSFGQIGSEPVVSSGNGRAYGLEIFAQRKLTAGTFFTVSYTLFKSEFTGADGIYKPSSWDNNNLLSAILGQKFKKNWELGLKFRYAGRSPYTPFDLVASQRNYLSTGSGVLDYNLVNSERLGSFKQIDIRLDKKWNLNRVAIDIFIDIQNVTNFSSPGSLQYTFKRNSDNTAFETTDGQPVQSDGSNAIPNILKDTAGTILPTLGFIVEF